MKTQLDQFKDHATDLGMKISVISADLLHASVLCTNNPTAWRLWFRYGSGLGVSSKSVQFSWYIGPKFYTHKMSLDRFLTFTRGELDDMVHKVEAANKEFARIEVVIKQLPIDVKNEIKVAVR